MNGNLHKENAGKKLHTDIEPLKSSSVAADSKLSTLQQLGRTTHHTHCRQKTAYKNRYDGLMVVVVVVVVMVVVVVVVVCVGGGSVVRNAI